jgi:hypothetical protein
MDDERKELIRRLYGALNGVVNVYILGDLLLDVARYLEGLEDD